MSSPGAGPRARTSDVANPGSILGHQGGSLERIARRSWLRNSDSELRHSATSSSRSSRSRGLDPPEEFLVLQLGGGGGGGMSSNTCEYAALNYYGLLSALAWNFLRFSLRTQLQLQREKRQFRNKDVSHVTVDNFE